MQLFGALVLGPLLNWLTGAEVIWRGYVLNHLGLIGGGGKPAYWGAIILNSAIFAAGHLYQGPVGAIGVFFTALVLGGLYLGTGRNLWLPMFTHAFTDTIAFLVLFTGLDKMLDL